MTSIVYTLGFVLSLGMTRINVGIPVETLVDKHLLAEHREIKRIPNSIKKGRYNLNGIPEQFTLGKGHVKFFYNKLKYLKNRYYMIYNECKRRGFNVTDFKDSFDNLPSELYNDWRPRKRDSDIVRERIELRLKEKRVRRQGSEDGL